MSDDYKPWQDNGLSEADKSGRDNAMSEHDPLHTGSVSIGNSSDPGLGSRNISVNPRRGYSGAIQLNIQGQAEAQIQVQLQAQLQAQLQLIAQLQAQLQAQAQQQRQELQAHFQNEQQSLWGSFHTQTDFLFLIIIFVMGFGPVKFPGSEGQNIGVLRELLDLMAKKR